MRAVLLSAAIACAACSGARITNRTHSVVARPQVSIEPGFQPGSLGGTAQPVEPPGIWDLPEGLASRSDVNYAPGRFPAPTGLRGLIERILAEEGVPVEFAALPWIESDYNVACCSPTGAAGPWQFMRGTAGAFDLRMDSEVDERYSWPASTRAAARLLRRLRDTFGSWTLALAAYNCGEGTMSRAVSRGDSAFVSLDLPPETKAFVPRFASALSAYRQLPEDEEALAIIWVPPATDLRVLAAECGIHPDSIVSLNRSFLRERTPASGEGWELVVPAGISGRAFETAWRMDGAHYSVREGDTWSTVAERLNVTEAELRAANPGRVLEVGALLALPEPDEMPVNALSGDAEGWYYYTVRSGDTLSGIGASAGVSSREVAEWNGISRDALIHPGQRLLLRGSPPDPASEGPAPVSPAGEGGVTHEVVSGDTLWDLAVRYGTTVEEIQRLNGLTGSSLIPGMVLVIRAE